MSYYLYHKYFCHLKNLLNVWIERSMGIISWMFQPTYFQVIKSVNSNYLGMCKTSCEMVSTYHREMINDFVTHSGKQ